MTKVQLSLSEFLSFCIDYILPSLYYKGYKSSLAFHFSFMSIFPLLVVREIQSRDITNP